MLRERAGADSLELRLQPGATAGEAITALGADERLGELLERLPVRLAVNREYAPAETVLHEGDELAVIPPVSGGAAGRASAAPVRVTSEPLSAARLEQAVADPRAGAVVTFQGVTREVERLEYEAYATMAAERIEQILRECVARHGACAAAAEHRVGSVPLGEPSVVIAVSAPHREQAFAAAREAIDRIKDEAPIWKREHDRDGGARWVEGAAPHVQAPAPGGEGGAAR
jgi:molybdopterin synthase catalytic subunit